MQKLSLLSLLLLLLTTACQKEEATPRPGTRIIFGEVFGACVGDCRILYSLDDTGIYPDTNQDDPTIPYEDTPFESQALDADAYDLAKPLLDFPENILSASRDFERQQISDQDAYLRIETPTGAKVWIYDYMDETMDQEWQDYFQKVRDIAHQLRL